MINTLKRKNGYINLKLIIPIILILLIISFIIIFNIKSTKKVIILEKIPYEYFVVYSNKDKVGVVDKKGNEIIKSEYDEIYIPNQSKDVFICVKDNETKIFNKAGNKIFKEFENVAPIMISEDTLEMEKYLLSYKKDDKYGLVSIEGKKITDAIYTDVSSLKGKPGSILVRKDDKYGIIDSTGKTIIEEKYNYIKSDEYYTENEEYTNTGYIISEKTKEGIIYGYANSDGKIIVEPKYESISRAIEGSSSKIYLIVMERGKKGVLEDGNILIKNNFQSISYFSNSKIFVVEKTGKYGFYSIDGKEILKPEFSKYIIAGNYISVQKDEKTYLYDIHGNIVNTANYTTMSETDNPSYFIAKDEKGYYSIISKDITLSDNYTSIQYAFDDYFIVSKENEKTGVINTWNDKKIENKYEYILVIEGTNMLECIMENGDVDIYSNKLEKIITMTDAVVEKINTNYTVVYSENEMKYLDNNGNFVENTEVYPDNALYAICKDGQWGFADKTGEIKVSCKYDMVTEINEYGFAGIKQDDRWGVIDSEGNVLVVPTYEIEYYYFPEFVGKYLLDQSEIVHCVELEEKG